MKDSRYSDNTPPLRGSVHADQLTPRSPEDPLWSMGNLEPQGSLPGVHTETVKHCQVAMETSMLF